MSIGLFNDDIFRIKRFIEENNKLPSLCTDYDCNQYMVPNKKRKISYLLNSTDKNDTMKKYVKNKSFDYAYKNIIEFIEKNDRIPNIYTPNRTEKTLGIWCKTQRYLNKKGKLNEYKINKLNELKHWFWELDRKKIFIDKYEKVVQFIKENNRLPVTYKMNENERVLGIWCYNQRRKYRGEKLNEYEIYKLNELTHWYWEVDHTELFNKKYEKVVQFVRENDRLPSLNTLNKAETVMGYWCNDQRRKNKMGKLNEYKINKLNELPHWYWMVRFTKMFDEEYEKVLKFIKENDRLPCVFAIDKNEEKLGIWCENQREKNKNGKLKEYKINRLNGLPHWYWGFE